MNTLERAIRANRLIPTQVNLRAASDGDEVQYYAKRFLSGIYGAFWFQTIASDDLDAEMLLVKDGIVIAQVWKDEEDSLWNISIRVDGLMKRTGYFERQRGKALSHAEQLLRYGRFASK
jgi:hypothetical protein